MGRAVVKLAEGEYVEWGTIVDAPVSYIVDRDEAVATWGEERVQRADENGHSWTDVEPQTPEQIIAANRAGEGERGLTLDQIREEFKREEAPRPVEIPNKED